MEAWPFLKRLLGTCLVFFVVPVKHLGLVFEVHALAEPLEDVFRIIEEVICIDDANLDSFLLGLGGIVAIRCAVRLLCAGIAVGAVCMTWPNLARTSQIIEHSANLVIPSFDWIEIIEARKLVEGRDGAAVVGWDARVWVADQESKVEFCEHVSGDDSWVAGLWLSVVWCESVLMDRACTVDAVDTIGDSVACSDSALDTLQRRCDACRLAAGRHKIVDNVLDEDALTLVVGK